MKYDRKKNEPDFSSNDLDEIDFFSTEEEDRQKLNKKNHSQIEDEKPHTLPPWVVEAQKRAKEKVEEIHIDEETLAFLSQPIKHIRLADLFGNLDWVKKLSKEKQLIFETLYRMLTLTSFQLKDLDNQTANPYIDDEELASMQTTLDLNAVVSTEEQESRETIITAIEKLYNGDYGICHCCHKKIGERRLQAKPYAIYCIDCREKLEKLQSQNII